MTAKLQSYIQLAGQTAAQVTKDPKNWVKFLNTASRVYRYPFHEQLMIHAQRPQATACASFEVWNRRMRRSIRRGSKGIGLVNVNRRGYPGMRYVFDIKDTVKRQDSSTPFLWQYKEGYQDIVAKALEERFGIPGSYGLVDQFQCIADKLAQDYWENHHKDIIYECEGSRLEELDELSIGSKFRLAVAVSISYVLIKRCNLSPEKHFTIQDFQDVLDFNTQRIVKILGTAVSESSEQVLRTIAVAIYSYEHKEQTVQNVSQPAQPEKPSVREIYDKYKPIIRKLILDDDAYQNACQNSDKEEAMLESQEAVKRAVFTVKDPEFLKLYYDMEKFRIRLQQEVFEDTYPMLSAVQEPDEIKADTISEDNTEGLDSAADETLETEDSIQEDSEAEAVSKDSQPEPDSEGPVFMETEVVQEPPVPESQNFKIMDMHLGEGGPKAKFQMNMRAIVTLKQIESEGRVATPEEQEILSKYVGWGGIPNAFEPKKEEWAKEYKELDAALTPEEYASARLSTLNAHYTSPTVIQAIYQAITRMGFKFGKVLEPACGIGNFFGLIPEMMSESKLYGVELDDISGRIARLLYPDAKIDISGFEKTDFPNDFFDLAIGNVPFGQYQVNDPEYNKLGFSIHNYFLAKSLDKVCPGGILAFITTRYTMDSKDIEV